MRQDRYGGKNGNLDISVNCIQDDESLLKNLTMIKW
jgi:hypothetical protein